MSLDQLVPYSLLKKILFYLSFDLLVLLINNKVFNSMRLITEDLISALYHVKKMIHELIAQLSRK